MVWKNSSHLNKEMLPSLNKLDIALCMMILKVSNQPSDLVFPSKPKQGHY
jgi:hypothetical protein